MKNQNIVFIAIAFAFALAPVTGAKPIPQGGPTVEAAANAPAATADSTSSEAPGFPVVTIHSIDNVTREKSVHSCWPRILKSRWLELL